MKKLWKTGHTTIEDPIEALKAVQGIVADVQNIAINLNMVGIGCGEDLLMLSSELQLLSADAVNGINREAQERFAQSQQASANMLGAALAASGVHSNKEDKQS